MILDGRQLQLFSRALLDAYPNQPALGAMVAFGINQNLNAIAGGANLGEVVFSLIDWALSHNQGLALLEAAYQHNPGNPLLLKAYHELKPILASAESLPTAIAATAALTADELVARTQDPGTALHERILAGLELGRIGDPRFASRISNATHYLLPPMIAVAAGKYTLGSAEPLRADSRDTHEHRVELAQFFIGQFLVTNAEYALFVNDGGYAEESWWDTDRGEAWRQGIDTAAGLKQQQRVSRSLTSEQRILDQLQNGQISAEKSRQLIALARLSDQEFELYLARLYPDRPYRLPRFWDNPTFNNPAQPVVGVCWYEARAYCNWLAAQAGRAFRLPSEAEWEGAARGRSARRYPFGNSFDPRLCNTAEGKLGRTTPVGVFPGGATPEGCADMAGNVFEFTSSAFFAYPYVPDDGREDPAEESEPRIIRGGAYAESAGAALAAYRNLSYPSYWNSYVGFRLATTSP